MSKKEFDMFLLKGVIESIWIAILVIAGIAGIGYLIEVWL